MDEAERLQAARAAGDIRHFMSNSQFAAMVEGCRGEEKDYFMRQFLDLSERIGGMPQTYETDGQGDQAKAQLHYFTPSSDFYITEKDMEGGIRQAFGFVILNGDGENAEMGYISIQELVAMGAELDLHFDPKTIAELKGELTQEQEEEAEQSVAMDEPDLDKGAEQTQAQEPAIGGGGLMERLRLQREAAAKAEPQAPKRTRGFGLEP